VIETQVNMNRSTEDRSGPAISDVVDGCTIREKMGKADEQMQQLVARLGQLIGEALAQRRDPQLATGRTLTSGQDSGQETHRSGINLSYM
jgi:hypothetical protein